MRCVRRPSRQGPEGAALGLPSAGIGFRAGHPHLAPPLRKVAGAIGEPDGGFLRSALEDLLQGHLAGEGLASGVDLAGILAEGGATSVLPERSLSPTGPPISKADLLKMRDEDRLVTLAAIKLSEDSYKGTPLDARNYSLTILPR